ncbi:MAG: hypothetical protein R2712_13080 [Vicinamibacterales bacterium]
MDRNGVLSNGTGLPAVCFCGGFTPPSATAPVGVPVGLEILGREWSEPRLLALAHAWECRTRIRRAPASVPTLAHRPG